MRGRVACGRHVEHMMDISDEGGRCDRACDRHESEIVAEKASECLLRCVRSACVVDWGS